MTRLVTGQWTDARARAVLRALFDAAVASAAPASAVRRHLPGKPSGRCVVVGAGKAAAAMAAGVDAAWPDVDLSGVVVTRYGHATPAGRIRVLEAGHPVPDLDGLRATRHIFDALRDLGSDDLVIALISGGGSALLTAPVGSVTLAEKQAVTSALLASGAPIREMNLVRRHLSEVKGGGLAAAARPARLVTLAISDVPGDDPAVIASGPTVPSPFDLAAAREILTRYRISSPPSVDAALSRPTPRLAAEPTPDDYRIVASPLMALSAAAEVAEREGITPLILGDAIEGESREVGIAMAGIAAAIRRHGLPVRAPALLLSGGETSVTLGERTDGRGGRNTEFLLSLAVSLRENADIWAIAGDTDGIDGSEDAAGAIVSPDSLARARTAGLDPAASLALHDSYTVFEAIGDLVKTGPTLTNVNDVRAILVV
jgi:hydroxypyruvate reductase